MMNELFALIILLCMSAFFSASETAITSLSRFRISRMVEQKIRGAKLVQRIKERPNEFLSTVLIGNNFVNIAASSLATSVIINFCERSGLGGIATSVGIATGLMTFVILAFGEITPKTVALRRAENISLAAAPIIIVLEYLLKPIAYAVGLISRPIIILLGGKTPETGPFITQEEIRLILLAGEKEGVIEEEESRMLTSVFDFGDTVVKEVMTPRPDVIALEVTKSLEDLKQLIAESGHSRIPVYENNLDNIIGIVYAKDLLNNEPASLRDLLRPAIFFPETKNISDLLREMQAARTHLVVIVDEFGVASGVVTLEDLIEEIVGEIHDEFERDEKMIEKLDDKTFLVDGRVGLKDLNDELHLNLPEKDYASLGGLVFGQLGKVPSVGNAVTLGPLRLSVERLHRRRVTRVKIEKSDS